jgi:hypothetical protein
MLGPVPRNPGVADAAAATSAFEPRALDALIANQLPVAVDPEDSDEHDS